MAVVFIWALDCLPAGRQAYARDCKDEGGSYNDKVFNYMVAECIFLLYNLLLCIAKKN